MMSFMNRYGGWIICLCAILLAILTLCGCGDARPPQPPGGVDSAGDTLQSLGRFLVWTGGISAAAGAAIRILALVYPAAAPLAGLATLAAVGGSSVLACGSSIQWLADRPYIMVACIVASLGVAAWWHWPDLRRVLARRLDHAGRA